MSQSKLPYPQLAQIERDGIAFFTDEELGASTGVRVAFTQRQGGASVGPYSSLNLALQVEDDPAMVAENRKRLLAALGVPDASLLVPNQVHGDNLVIIDDADGIQIERCASQIAQGADGILVGCENVAAQLCVADCMPVILIAPEGWFAVVHAGWRGVMNRIVPKALSLLCGKAQAQPADCNIYIGPYIHAECFEVSAELAGQFSEAFGDACVPCERHVDLGVAMRESLRQAGADPRRIADVDACTVCENERFFSYRAQDGVCGRHGAIAVRIER